MPASPPRSPKGKLAAGWEGKKCCRGRTGSPLPAFSPFWGAAGGFGVPEPNWRARSRMEPALWKGCSRHGSAEGREREGKELSVEGGGGPAWEQRVVYLKRLGALPGLGGVSGGGVSTPGNQSAQRCPRLPSQLYPENLISFQKKERRGSRQLQPHKGCCAAFQPFWARQITTGGKSGGSPL